MIIIKTYVVNKGDTIYGISKSFGVDVDTLKCLNNLTSNTLIIGQILKIPNTNSITYIVKSGDTLYKIANMYNTSVDKIKNFNNLTSNNLTIGQIIMIPSSNSDDIISYTVKMGDSLYKIANMFNTSVDKIKSFNNLTSNNLSIGQIIKIPSNNIDVPSNTTYQNYIVKSGDTLYKIANMFDMSVDEIKNINNLTSNNLSVGQILRVKKQIGNTETENGEILECYGTGFSEPKYQTYTVVKGDSLYVIAKKFGTTVDNLISLNNLKTNSLSIGQVLKIKEIK